MARPAVLSSQCLLNKKKKWDFKLHQELFKLRKKKPSEWLTMKYHTALQSKVEDWTSGYLEELNRQ